MKLTNQELDEVVISMLSTELDNGLDHSQPTQLKADESGNPSSIRSDHEDVNYNFVDDKGLETSEGE